MLRKSQQQQPSRSSSDVGRDTHPVLVDEEGALSGTLLTRVGVRVLVTLPGHVFLQTWNHEPLSQDSV